MPASKMAVRFIHVVVVLLINNAFAATTVSSNSSATTITPTTTTTTTATTTTTTTTSTIPTTTATTAATTSSPTKLPKTTGLAKSCEFVLVDMKIRDTLSEALNARSKLVKFHLKFKDYPDDILNIGGGNLFRPYQWLRSTNTQGLSLLMLDDNFEVLSLSLLGIGVTTMNVELEEKPYGCMNDLTTDQKVNKTRQLLLNDFKIPGPGEKSGSLNKNERICNTLISPSVGVADFVQHCCHIDPDGFEKCENIERGVWINVLLVCIIIIKVLVVLYSPAFIPQTFYRKKFTETEYIYRIPAGKKKKRIKIVKTMYPSSYMSSNPPVRLEQLEGLDYFKISLNNMQMDKIYDFKMDKIQLSAKSRKLLPENYVPVSIVKMIYENVFRCKMRNIPVLKPCCDTGVCGILDIGCKVLTWFKCLRIFAKMVLLGFLAIPWVIRLVIYFTYERVTAEEKRTAAEKLNIDVSFGGSFTLYLTPLHGLFVAVYIIVTIDSLAYGLLGKAMKNRFKFILRKCLRDMKERSRLDAYGWAVGLFLMPFKRFGLVGFLLAPLYWLFLIPCTLPILAFYTFPALNLSIRLIIHLFIFMCPNSVVDHFNKMSLKMSNMKENLKFRDIGEEEFQGKENLSKREVCMHLTIIIMCLTSFWSLTFLLMECLSFFVEIGVYTLMGIIVNAGSTLQYVTLMFLIWLYASNSFGGVYKMYLDYHKIIRGLLLKAKHDEIKTAARQNEDTQDNTVFRVQSTSNAADTSSGIGIEVKEGLVRWETKGLLVFLNSVDQPFTPAKFFFETIIMNYCGCPGKLWQNTLKAFYNFMKIMVFLLFVVIVVLAFGNQFSTTNQMLATLAGGFVPFVFRNFFLKGGSSFTVDTESVQFVTEFDKAIAEFQQKWPVSDIIPVSITESGLPEFAGEAETEEEKDKEATTNLDKDHHQDENGNEETSPLVETNDAKINIDIESVDSETDNTKVDLIIDIARFDKMHRRLGMEGSLVNVGSLSMLGDGNAPIFRSNPPNHSNDSIFDV